MEEVISYKQNCFVEEINKETAKALVSKYHYLGDKAFMYSKAYGLWKLKDGNREEAELIGAAVFSPVTGIVAVKSWFGMSNQSEGILELTRLVMSPEHNGKNGASFLVGRSLRLLKQAKVRGVVSLADSEHHTGYIYQATNFKYYGLTDYKTDFWSVDNKWNPRGTTKDRQGVWIPRSRKHRYFYQIDPTLVPRLKQEPFPKEATRELLCCNNTGKVLDKRFSVEYACPRCK